MFWFRELFTILRGQTIVSSVATQMALKVRLRPYRRIKPMGPHNASFEAFTGLCLSKLYGKKDLHPICACGCVGYLQSKEPIPCYSAV